MVKGLIRIMLCISILSIAPAAQALSLKGVTAFATTVELNAATRGIVKSIAASPGQRVNKGDVLLSLDDTPHQAELKRTAAIARALQPDVTIAALELERAEELYALESLSQVDLQNAENKLTRAEGDYQAAQEENALAAYDQQQTIIRAPFDGRILHIHTNVSAYVDPAVETAKLISLVDSRRMTARATLSQNQWNSSLLNKKVSIKYRDKSYQGKVSYLALQGRPLPDGSMGFDIHVNFDSGQLIPAGMPVTLDIRE